jgi:predicted phosphodiesterase
LLLVSDTHLNLERISKVNHLKNAFLTDCCNLLPLQLVEWVVEEAQEYDFIILSGDIISIPAEEVTILRCF